MPKFQEIRQNPPRSAKSRGMDHCVCCTNSTLGPRLTRVSKGIRKGGKKTGPNQGGGGRGCGNDSAENKVSAQHQTSGSTRQPNGSGSERCDQYHQCGCKAPVVQSGGDTCPGWEQVRRFDPKVSDTFEDIPTEGVGEEWWDIIFQDIGILPTVQTPLDEEHPYVVADIQDEASGSN